MALRALLLDFDGTLADSLPMLRAVYSRFVSQLGGVPSDEEFDRLNGPPLPEVVARLCDAYGASGTNAGHLALYESLIDSEFQSIRPFDGADTLLRHAARLGLQVGVVTSNSRMRVESWLAAKGLAEMCRLLVCGEDIARGKPDPEPYRLALDRVGVDAGDAVAIEDSVSGLRSAQQAGIATIALGAARAEGLSPVAHIARLADAVPVIEQLHRLCR